MAMVDVVTCCLQADLPLKSVGLVQRLAAIHLVLFCIHCVNWVNSRTDSVTES